MRGHPPIEKPEQDLSHFESHNDQLLQGGDIVDQRSAHSYNLEQLELIYWQTSSNRSTRSQANAKKKPLRQQKKTPPVPTNYLAWHPD